VRFLGASLSRRVTHRTGWRLGSAVGAVTGAALAVATATPGPALAASLPSATPASGTPQLAYSGTPVAENVRQLVQCGGKMYAVGTFSLIKRYSTTYPRSNVFSFSATSPFAMTSWAPTVNGTVNSIALSPDCSTAYLGGAFTSVNGTTVKDIAAVSTSTGAVITTFGHSAGGQVETLAVYKTHLLAGGYYTSINGSSANPYMTSLSLSTGKDDGFIHLGISGSYYFCGTTRCTSSNPTRVYNQQLSHGGTLDLVEGDFTSVGGLSRQQAFMLNLSGSTAVVTSWTSAEFSTACWYTQPFYLQAAAWSPNDSTVYVGTTGYHPYNMPTGATPRTGLCDAAASFPAAQQAVSHAWINYTGCDSLYSAGADASAAYFAGHERWSQNPDDCDAAGPGAISAPGFEGLSLTNGNLIFNPTRSRGQGADDILVTSAGVWIASDNGFWSGSTWYGSSACGGVYGHAGICFLPYG
jgi:hypothetical protein